MTSEAEDFALQKTHLSCELGVSGSGARRYAAAMYFYVQGHITPEILEIYRRCCHDDVEDPIDLARFEGLPVDWLTR